MTTRRLSSPWRVEVAEHQVSRWRIPHQVLELYAINQTQARVQGAREVHRRAGVAALRPLLRITYMQITATAIGSPPSKRRPAPVGGGRP
jgi:hypothetical protein